MYRYKPEEGRNARQATFWLGEGMIVFGCYSLRGTLNRWEGMRSEVFENFSQIPVLGVTLNGSMMVAVVVFLLASVSFTRFLATKKTADHLIEVEDEMKKVTWPSFREASNSSIIVVGCVLMLMGFLAFSDWALGSIFRAVLWEKI